MRTRPALSPSRRVAPFCSRFASRLASLLVVLLTGPAPLPLHAQTVAAAAAPALATAAAPPALALSADDAALLQAFGQRDGLQRLATDFVSRVRADGRVGHFFSKTKPKNLADQLTDQFCQLLHGPCVYEGDAMRASHADHAIRRADFLALVEVLQAAMDAQGIPFAAQNRLLAQLAPMHRDIINTR